MGAQAWLNSGDPWAKQADLNVSKKFSSGGVDGDGGDRGWVISVHYICIWKCQRKHTINFKKEETEEEGEKEMREEEDNNNN